MKPLVSQTMANAIGLSLLYKPEPNWDTYFRLRDVATGVEARLVSINLIPRDRVDVQSFMYVAWQDSK